MVPYSNGELAQMEQAGKNAEHCIFCGDIIPEGRQVCPNCENKAMRQDGWILVSERLPEECTPVYATLRAKGRDNWIIEGFYTKCNFGTPWGNIPMLMWGEAEVIAWMPKTLPEPYREEKRQ